jgi:hypothetical protein
MKKVGLLLLIAVVAVVLAAPPANAACLQTGTIVYSIVSPTAGSFYLKNDGPVGFYYVYTSTSTIFINTLAAAHCSGARVRILGSAATCPTAGALRTGGAIQQVTLF